MARMDVLGALGSADRWLLLKINRDWANPVFDAVLPAVTEAFKASWVRYGAFPAGLGIWLWKGRRRALEALVAAALAAGAGDLLAYRAIKPWVARPRPAVAGQPVVLRAPVNGALSFPSNHAVNTAAAAAVLSVAYPAGAPAFAGIAAVVGYSRVYVGAHYPSDVLGGFAMGAA